MTINEYQQEALRTEADIKTKYPSLRLLHGLIGLSAESGEALDILKKNMFQEHNLDKYHLALELGDVAWYLAVSADSLGYDLETILQMNVTKRLARYPDGFDANKSIYRKEGDI